MEDKSKTILIVEDDDGLLLILSEIVEELGCSVVGKQTAQEAVDWLSSNMPHLMVLDYTLPDSSGSDLINRLKEKGAEVPPFIVSTGHGDEHIAVEMMKLGARDYVTKDSTFINRISIVVDRVIREIENENRLKEVELRLIEANQFGLQIIENVQEGIVVYDLDLKYKLWNPFMVELTGYNSEEVIGKNPWDIFPFLANLGVIDNLRKALKGEKLQELDFEFFIPKNGRTGWASDRTTQLYNAKGELIGLIATIRDITERKKAELSMLDSERQIRMITNNIPAFISYVDNKLYYRYVNENYERLSGFKSHEIIGKHIREILGEEYMVSNLENIQTVLSGKEVYYENSIETKMGENLYVSVSCIPHLDDKGKVAGYYVFSNDITERKKTEEMLTRLSTSLAHLEGKAFFEAVSEETSNILGLDFVFIGRLNPDGQSVSVVGGHARGEPMGPLTYSLAGTPCANVVGKLSCIYPANIQQLFPDDELLKIMGIEGYMGTPLFSKDLQPIGIMVGLHGSALTNTDRINQIFSIYIDRVAAELQRSFSEEALRESESQFKGLFEQAGDAIFIADSETGIIVNANQRAATLLKYSIEEIKGKHQRELHPPENKFFTEQTFLKHKLEVKERNFANPIENEVLCSDGSVIPVEILASPVNYKGKDCIMGIFRDISERKRAEEELRKSNERYEMFISQIEEGVYRSELTPPMPLNLSQEEQVKFLLKNMYLAECNPAFLLMYGFNDHKELLGKSSEESSFITGSKESKKVKSAFVENGYKISDFITKEYNRDGELRYFSNSAIGIIEDNYLIRVWGTQADITERILNEKALKESEERFQKVAESAEEWFWEIDTKGMYTYSNSVVERILGYSAEEVVGKKYFFDLFEPDEREVLKAKAFENINNHVAFKGFVNVNVNKNGNRVVIRSSGSPIFDDHGVLIGFRGVDADITKESIMEKALKESEERFRLAFKTSPDAINFNTLEGKYVEINDGFTQLTGYTEKDVIGKLSSEINIWANPKDREKLVEGLQKEGFVVNLESLYRMKDGSLKTALMSARIININEKPHILSITRDISERKKFEDSLKTLSWAVEQSPASIVITDTAGCIEYVNRKFTEVTGYSANDAIGLNPSVLKSGYTSKLEYKKLWDTILSGKEWQGIFCNLKKNGDKYWENALISPITNEKGEVIHFVAVKEDITEKRDLERKTLANIVEAEERERNRFSRELHDGLGPILSTIKLFFQWLHQSDDESKKDMIFENGISNLNEAIDTIREISNNLSPRTITTFGVNAALKNFISNINQTQKLKIDYESNIDNRFNKNIEIIIYRIVTELINNTLKYANASKVTINLNEIDGYIKLQYTDNGIEFDYNNSMNQGKGIGLFNIIQRINTLDGTINVVSSAGNGVNIIISLPLESNNLL